MLPLFIIWFIRRYRQKQNLKKLSAVASEKIKTPLTPLASILLFILLVVFEAKSYGQNKNLNYQIVRNGNKVGTLHFSEGSNGEMDYLKMISDVKMRFILSFTAHVNEEAVYRNGVLVRSSIYRTLNGNEQENKQHEANDRQYIIRTGERSQVTKIYPITYNMLSFYSKEPENISKAYSDIFQTFISIENVGLHKYKITLPDGNYNCYQYKNGVLVLVEVHHSFYSASIVLNN